MGKVPKSMCIKKDLQAVNMILYIVFRNERELSVITDNLNIVTFYEKIAEDYLPFWSLQLTSNQNSNTLN